MPSTYSPSLRLELMGAGEQAGNWGNTTNTNLGSLLEQAITGVGSIPMLDATTTLVSGAGIVDQARNAVLVLTGTLTANRDVIVPSFNKFYAVRNATAGGYSVVVKTSAGTGVMLPNGYTQLMYCDGTNVVLASVRINSTNGNVTVAGALDVGGTITNNGNPIIPTGSIFEFAGITIPNGWLLCDGAAVSRTAYNALFAMIGTAYGAGDGSTTFNVPDRRDRVGVGAGTTYTRGQTGGAVTATTSTNGLHNHGGATAFHTLTLSQIPAHGHSGTTYEAGAHSHVYENNIGGSFNGSNFDGVSGNNSSNTGRVTSVEGIHVHNFDTNAAGGGTGHQHSISSDGNHTHTVSTIQPYVASNYIIKF